MIRLVHLVTVHSNPDPLPNLAIRLPLPAKNPTPAVTAFSSADPILSTVNPRNFPKQFARLSQQDKNSRRMDEFLRGLAEIRTENEIRSQEEAKQYEQLRQAREQAREEALKSGLPPPGADTIMIRTLIPKRQPRAVRPKQKKGSSNIQSARFAEVKRRTQNARIMQTVSRTEVQAPTQNKDESVSTMSTTDQNFDRTRETNRASTVFDTLANILFDRSADLLSPHLATPAVENEYGDAGYHPRWKFNRLKIKPPHAQKREFIFKNVQEG